MKDAQGVLRGELLVLEKEVGETPLACMERWRQERIAECGGLDGGDAAQAYASLRMTYAGRLDPMASGVLIALTGERVHDKDSFLRLPKTYICTALLGVETDTYDVLGIPFAGAVPDSAGSFSVDEVRSQLDSFVGTFVQEYPPYSSKTVGGKQLHAIARAGALDGLDDERPTQQVTVLSIEDVSTEQISVMGPEGLVSCVIRDVQKVFGDFRQTETIEAWKAIAPKLGAGGAIQAVTFTVSVSGGTYIRGIVREFGKRLGTGACIWKLHRTRVGDFAETNAGN